MGELIDLKKVRQDKFGMVECDFYEDKYSDKIYMTAEQLGRALEYSKPRRAINNLISRNTRLRDKKFSTDIKLMSVEGSREVKRNTKVFTEDGILEVTFLSGQPKAQEFRDFAREVIKELRRTGKVVVTKEDFSSVDILQTMVDALREQNEKMDIIKSRQDTHEKELKQVSSAIMVDDTSTTRQQFNQAVREYAAKAKIPYKYAYNKVYKTINNNRCMNLQVRARNRSMKVIDYLQENNLLEYALRITINLLDEVKNTAV
jgi:prophage antirepressor-like protein